MSGPSDKAPGGFSSGDFSSAFEKPIPATPDALAKEPAKDPSSTSPALDEGGTGEDTPQPDAAPLKRHVITALFLAISALWFASAPAHAQKTKAQINTEIGINLPDQTVGQITPQGLRAVTNDIVNSIMPTAPVTGGNLACFSGTTGLLQDCGTSPSTNPLVVGTTTITGGTSSGILYNNGGVVGNALPGGPLYYIGGSLNSAPLDVTSWALIGQTGSAWNVVGANGVSVPTAGTTTQGIQEAINASYAGIGTGGNDLDIRGGDLSTGGAQVVNTASTINFKAAQGKRTRIGAVTFNTNSGVGGNNGLVFDSQEMAHWSLQGGQVVYQGTGYPILFKPVNGTPLDGLKNIVDSHFFFTTSAPVAFDFSAGGSATNSTYDFGELNYQNANNPPSNAAFFVPSVAGGQNFSDNTFVSHHLHGVASGKTAWKVGNGPPAGGQTFGHNFNFLNISGFSGYNGIDTYESGSFYLATIENVGAGIPIKLEPGANNNVIIAPYYDDATTAISDSGTGNVVIGNGKILAGAGAVLSVGALAPVAGARFQTTVSTDHVLTVTANVGLPDGVAVNSVTSNNTANKGFEIRGSAIALNQGPVTINQTLAVTGAVTGASYNKVTITSPATGSTLTVLDGKTATISNTLTFTGTDGSSVAFGAGGTVIYNGGALGTPASGTLTNATGLPISTGLTGAGTGVLAALSVNVGTAGAFVVNGGALGSPSSVGTLPSPTIFGTINWNSDTYLGRASAAKLMLGQADAAAPVAQTLGVQNVIAGTSNTAGANFTIAGSQGTGTGLGGAVILQVAPPGTTGTAQNALVGGAALTPSATAPGGMVWTQGVGVPFTPWTGSVAEWRAGTDQRFSLGGKNLLATGVSFNVFNDAISANLGLEFRASVTGFTQGGVCIYNNSCTDPGIGNLGVGGTIKGGATVVASLPTCNAAAKGTRYFVTDANATTYHSTAVGGGTNNMGVLCDGANWYLD